MRTCPLADDTDFKVRTDLDEPATAVLLGTQWRGRVSREPRFNAGYLTCHHSSPHCASRIYNPIMQLSEQDRCVPWQGQCSRGTLRLART